MARNFLTGEELSRDELAQVLARARELKAGRPEEGRGALAEASDAPVVNALTPAHHPCQALADLMTLAERFGDLEGLRVAYVGDGNNVARSLAVLGGIAGVAVVVSSPADYELDDMHGAELVADPAEAVAGADAVYADVWVSMGDEEDADARREALAPYQLNADLLARASD